MKSIWGLFISLILTASALMAGYALSREAITSAKETSSLDSFDLAFNNAKIKWLMKENLGVTMRDTVACMTAPPAPNTPARIIVPKTGGACDGTLETLEVSAYDRIIPGERVLVVTSDKGSFAISIKSLRK